MADTKLVDLPTSSPLDGTELMYSVQAGNDVKVELQEIADFIGGGSGSPAGSDTQVQFNDAGSFGADADLTYNKTTNALTVGGLVHTPIVQAHTSAGLTLEAQGGGDVLTVGAGGGVNATAYGGWNFDGATATTLASFGASKTLESLPTVTYPSLTEISYVKGVTSAIQTQINGKISASSTNTLSNKTLDNSNIITVRDDRFTLQDDADNTKQAVFDLSSIPTASTRTFTLPASAGTLATTQTSQTFTNKTVNLTSNTLSGTKAQFDTACSDGNFLYVGDVTQYTDEQAQDAVGTILVDSSEIDFTYNDATPSITASIVAGSIDETKLDTSVNASLDLADTAAQNTFRTIAVSGQSNIVADSATDTLTIVAGTNITLTTDAGTDTLTINASGGGSGLTQPQVMAIGSLNI